MSATFWILGLQVSHLIIPRGDIQGKADGSASLRTQLARALRGTFSEVAVPRALYPAFVLTQADSQMLSEG